VAKAVQPGTEWDVDVGGLTQATDGQPAASEDASLSELLLALYSGAHEADGWYRFQELLAQRLDIVNSVLSLRWPSGSRKGLLYAFKANLNLSALNAEQQRYLAIDPFVNIPEGKAVRLHDLVQPEEFRKTPYYLEWLVPSNVEYAVGVDVRDPGRFHARLRLCRSKSSRNFSDADCRFVEMLAPHLRMAIRLYSDLDEVKSERAFYADAMDQLTMATIILDEHGRVIHTNRLAELVLRQRDGITMANDQLVLSNREDSKQFRDLIGKAVAAYTSGRPSILQVMRVRRPSGRADFGLVVRPSSPGLMPDGEHLNATVAVFIGSDVTEPDAKEVPAEVIQKLFGLTPKEATLALRLAAGRTLQEAAEELGISPNTARAHLRAIFSKTGFDRQTKLVRALLQSVAMLAQ
jgi:DNA-binding CsgD family transcriptional regulator/PAS domain-containing protein